MSYRIHLHICNAEDYIKYYQNYLENPNNYFDPPSKSCIELMDSLDLIQFNNIDSTDEEYPSYILNKEDFRKILEHYRYNQLELANERLKSYAEYKELYKDENKLYPEETFEILSKFSNHNNNSKWYFEKLIKEDKFILDSSYFTYQYFYLVNLYENYTDEEVIIITHG